MRRTRRFVPLGENKVRALGRSLVRVGCRRPPCPPSPSSRVQTSSRLIQTSCIGFYQIILALRLYCPPPKQSCVFQPLAGVISCYLKIAPPPPNLTPQTSLELPPTEVEEVNGGSGGGLDCFLLTFPLSLFSAIFYYSIYFFTRKSSEWTFSSVYYKFLNVRKSINYTKRNMFYICSSPSITCLQVLVSCVATVHSIARGLWTFFLPCGSLSSRHSSFFRQARNCHILDPPPMMEGFLCCSSAWHCEENRALSSSPGFRYFSCRGSRFLFLGEQWSAVMAPKMCLPLCKQRHGAKNSVIVRPSIYLSLIARFFCSFGLVTLRVKDRQIKLD